ncbi:hypothetical protein HMPREF1318_2939 [Actinomyces massiliensis F0489]|uniref:Uncharacterized protein n=1 Tax=Actinomyces massiliensis F0489 TaxID=1125718 RepID=J1HKI3_9ACTO|nr:hypothetical protein HMPREF1318_2939 [Actinomyces massiliensis F0489]
MRARSAEAVLWWRRRRLRWERALGPRLSVLALVVGGL